ncbi:class E sortase [Streptomyces uncialis]
MTAVRPERDSGPGAADPPDTGDPGAVHGDGRYGGPYEVPRTGSYEAAYEVPGAFEAAVRGLADPLSDPLPDLGGPPGQPPPATGEWYDPQGYARDWYGGPGPDGYPPQRPAPDGYPPQRPAPAQDIPYGYVDHPVDPAPPSHGGPAPYPTPGHGTPGPATPRHGTPRHPGPAPAPAGPTASAPAATGPAATGPAPAPVDGTGRPGPAARIAGPGPLPAEVPAPHTAPFRPYDGAPGGHRAGPRSGGPGPERPFEGRTARHRAAERDPGDVQSTVVLPAVSGAPDGFAGPRWDDGRDPGAHDRSAHRAPRHRDPHVPAPYDAAPYDGHGSHDEYDEDSEHDEYDRYGDRAAYDDDPDSHGPAPLSRVEARRAARARKPTAGVVVSRALGELFITVGVLMLLFVTYQLWWTNIRAQQQANGAANQIQEDWAKGKRAPGSFEPGQGFAIMHIPALDVVVPVAEGIDKKSVLDRGLVGHYAEGSLKTAMPEAKSGNFAVAGHRNTHGEPFRYINRLKPGDPIVIETQDTYFVYKMASILPQTPPSNVSVLEPIPPGSGFTGPGRYLTLTTCTPEFTSKYRMIVWGKMAEERPRSEGKPDALVG